MASSKNAGRRRFITRQHTSDTSEADATIATTTASTVKTPEEEEECERRRLEKISLPRDTPSAFVRVAPSSSSSSSSKSAALDWTFRGSKNGLAVPSSSRRLPHHNHHQQQPSVPLNSEPNNAQFHQLASEKIVQQQPLIYATLETSTGFPPDCDSLSLGFRPIRRDSLGSTSSSLAGSTVDSELTISNIPPDQPFDSSPQRIVKLPPHPTGGKDFPDYSASKLRPWSYYDGGGMLGPRTVLSSTGSASSYDNLDKMDSSSAQRNTLQLNSDATQVHLSPSPRFARSKHFDGGDPKRTPSPPSIRRHGSPFRSDDDRQFYVVGSRPHGNRDAASKETMSGEDKGEGPHFLDGVCRRRMAGGHVQVIPPHLVGVFDPSRFLPTNVHAPSDTNASGCVDAEKSIAPSVTKQPESTAYHPMGKLPSKLPVQPGYVRPTEPSGKSLLPRVSGQHTSRDVVDHSSSGHAVLPFASKDSGLSTGESLSSTKVNASRKSYRNEDLPAKDASPKFSDKRLFSTGRKGGCSVSNQEQESVTDLFHHVLPNTDSASHYGVGGPVFKDAGHHYPSTHHEPKDPQTSLSKPNAYLSTNHSSPSKQGSPKYAQTSTQKSSPKWESSISSRDGKKYEQTASPKTSPKIVPRHNDQTSALKSSPKWERTSSAKSNLVSSPKSSPKQERTAAGRRNLKWEAPSTTASAKASQQSSSTKSISKWEPASSSKDNARSKVSSSLTAAAATGDHLLASFSGTSNLEKAEGVENERIVERTPYNRTVSDTGQSRSQSAITESIRSQEKPRVPGDTSLTRTRSDRDKRKAATSTQLPATPDSVFSARRKQLSTTDRFDHRSRTDVTVDRASRSTTTTTRQNTDDARDTSMIDRVKPEAGNSPSEIKATLDLRSLNSPRKAVDDAVCQSDAASDRTSSTSSSLHGIENKGEERQRLRKSESGESDAHSTRSSAQSAEVVKVSLGEDVVRKQTVMDVGAMEAGSAAAAAAAAAGGDGLDATLDVYAINSNDVKDSGALKSTEDATVVVSNGTGSATVVADASTDDKEVNANVGDHGDLEVPRSKVRLPAACCPQTKTFTDILESIQVVTQPCGGALTVSSSQDTPGTTPVFGPPTSSSSVHNFPLFDVNDEPVVIKSSQSSLPDEVFASTPVDVSKKSLECITDQPSSVGQLILSGERSPVESAQRKTEQNADVVNNNLKETFPSTQTICLEQLQISSPVLHERRSVDSISSSSLVELPTKEELLADESSNVRTTANEPIYSVSVAQQQLRYPAVVDKAIFTVDKEISFVSGLLEPDKRGSLPGKVLSQTSLQDAGHMEFLPMMSESSPNAKLLMESAPFMLVTVSSVATTDREREAAPQSFSLGPVDKVPGAFHNPALTNVHAFPTVQSTTSHLNIVTDHREKSPLSPIAALPSVFDCCPLNEPINQNSSAILTNKNDDLVDRDKVVSDLDESDEETVDQGGNESKVSTASLDQLTQETEIFELAKTSAAYLKPEMTSTSSITFFPPVLPPTKTEESLRTAGKTQLVVTPSTTISKPVLSQNHDSAKHAFLFTSKESMPLNINEQPAYHPGIDNRLNASPFKSEVSPVMAALDDALAVLTSVVMENKTTGGDTLPRSAASAVPSKKDALKPDMEKVMLNLNTDTKKAGRSKSTNKEATKKRPSVVSHKEQQQQQQQHALFRSSPIATSHHSDPLEVMETVRQEIETVENRRRHRLSKDDSFNRPDSPMFHETLPLPKDSIIKRNREHCHDSSSSSDSGGGSPQVSPRLAPRNLRRSKRGGQDAGAASKSGSATTPLEMPGYRPFMGGHSSSGRTLSRHQSDIVLDMQSLPAGQHLHRTRRHNSDSADPGKGPWPKTVSLAQGMDAVTSQPAGTGVGASAGALGAREGKRRTDRFPLPSDIQQSLLLYNQQHGGRRGQSWMQAVDASVEGSLFTGVPLHQKDRTG